MALNSYKVHIFAQNKAKKIAKTGRGPLYFGQLMLPLLFGAYSCDPLLGPASIAGGHPVFTPTIFVQNVLLEAEFNSLLTKDVKLPQWDISRRSLVSKQS
jgi:hypothetical protein